MMSLIENPKLTAQGAKWFHTKDYGGGLNFSKTSLGEFMYEVMKVGAQVGTVWALNPTYQRSFTKATVYMTEAMKTDLEARTRFRFEDLPKIVVNGG